MRRHPPKAPLAQRGVAHSAGGIVSRLAARERCVPHFLFVLAKRKRWRPVKRKAALVQILGFIRSILPLKNPRCVPINGCTDPAPPPRVPLRYALMQKQTAEVCANSGRGIQRGGRSVSRWHFSALRMRRAPAPELRAASSRASGKTPPQTTKTAPFGAVLRFVIF